MKKAKTVKKALKPSIKKIVKKVVKPKVYGADYWRNRPLNDKEKDWKYGENTWVDGYVMSVDHEHRDQLMVAMKGLSPFGGVLEIGCGAGANLLRIAAEYPENQLAGTDVSDEMLCVAKSLLPKAIIENAEHTKLPFNDKEFSVVLADATLMYIGPDDIDAVLDEMDRVSKRAIIIIDRYSPNLKGEVVGSVWGRDYKTLLEARGYEVDEDTIVWSTSKNWEKYGRIWVARK